MKRPCDICRHNDECIEIVINENFRDSYVSRQSKNGKTVIMCRWCFDTFSDDWLYEHPIKNE